MFHFFSMKYMYGVNSNEGKIKLKKTQSFIMLMPKLLTHCLGPYEVQGAGEMTKF